MNSTARLVTAAVCGLGISVSVWGQASERRNQPGVQIFEPQNSSPSVANRGIQAGQAGRSTPITRQIRQYVGPARIEETSAKIAMEWWSAATNIPLVINWAAMTNEGIDPETEINVHLSRVPADVLLKLIISQFAHEIPMVIEPSQWYVEVLTMNQAVRKPIIRVYDISDLLMRIPNFDDAPDFDLTVALENTNSGGGGRGGGGGAGGGGGNSIFGDEDDDNDDDKGSTKAERAEEFAQLIRDTIEPEIWQAHGGQFCSVRYFDGRLIVNAPLFVHRQIGLSSSSGRRHRSPDYGGIVSGSARSSRSRGIVTPSFRPGSRDVYERNRPSAVGYSRISRVRGHSTKRTAGVSR